MPGCAAAEVQIAVLRRGGGTATAQLERLAQREILHHDPDQPALPLGIAVGGQFLAARLPPPRALGRVFKGLSGRQLDAGGLPTLTVA